MDKISNLKQEIINTLDSNKALDIITIDLENKSLSNEQKIIHYQQDAEDAWEEIEDLRRTVIDLRIYLGNGYRSSPHD